MYIITNMYTSESISTSKAYMFLNAAGFINAYVLKSVLPGSLEIWKLKWVENVQGRVSVFLPENSCIF